MTLKAPVAANGISVFLIYILVYQLQKCNKRKSTWVKDWADSDWGSATPTRRAKYSSLCLISPGEAPRSSGEPIRCMGTAQWPLLDQRLVCCRTPRPSCTSSTCQPAADVELSSPRSVLVIKKIQMPDCSSPSRSSSRCTWWRKMRLCLWREF